MRIIPAILAVLMVFIVFAMFLSESNDIGGNTFECRVGSNASIRIEDTTEEQALEQAQDMVKDIQSVDASDVECKRIVK